MVLDFLRRSRTPNPTAATRVETSADYEPTHSLGYDFIAIALDDLMSTDPTPYVGAHRSEVQS